jgi:hypothetical protein
MLPSMLSVHDGLAGAGRIRAISRAGARFSAREWATLVLLGIAAAALTGWGKTGLGIPGHAILRVMFPTALGLALVPRYGAASIVGLSGSAAAVILQLSGLASMGWGAATSLFLTGMLIDLALLRAASGWAVYLRLIAAGLVANSIALFVKAGSKFLAVPGGAPFHVWWPKASFTYLVCGALAGLLSAAVWFRAASRAARGGGEDQA